MIFNSQSVMKEIEARFPFSRALLHSKFHVGGCATCGYEPEESLAQVAIKHGKDADQMVIALNTGFQEMHSSEISPARFHELTQQDPELVLIDVRESWENEISALPGSILLTPQNLEATFEKARNSRNVIVYCHHGLRSLNAALYMKEHGIENAKSLTGGIDAYSVQFATDLPRY